MHIAVGKLSVLSKENLDGFGLKLCIFNIIILLNLKICPTSASFLRHDLFPGGIIAWATLIPNNFQGEVVRSAWALTLVPTIASVYALMSSAS